MHDHARRGIVGLHDALKAAGFLWLRTHGYTWVATEVALRSGRRGLPDVVGVKDGPWTVAVVEAKVTREDFARGFADLGDYCYVITPCGVVEAEMLPKGVGLLEADVDALAWDARRWKVNGLRVAKEARRREWSGSDGARAIRALQAVARRLSNLEFVASVERLGNRVEKRGSAA